MVSTKLTNSLIIKQTHDFVCYFKGHHSSVDINLKRDFDLWFQKVTTVQEVTFLTKLLLFSYASVF